MDPTLIDCVHVIGKFGMIDDTYLNVRNPLTCGNLASQSQFLNSDPPDRGRAKFFLTNHHLEANNGRAQEEREEPPDPDQSSDLFHQHTKRVYKGSVFDRDEESIFEQDRSCKDTPRVPYVGDIIHNGKRINLTCAHGGMMMLHDFVIQLSPLLLISVSLYRKIVNTRSRCSLLFHCWSSVYHDFICVLVKNNIYCRNIRRGNNVNWLLPWLRSFLLIPWQGEKDIINFCEDELSFAAFDDKWYLRKCEAYFVLSLVHWTHQDKVSKWVVRAVCRLQLSISYTVATKFCWIEVSYESSKALLYFQSAFHHAHEVIPDLQSIVVTSVRIQCDSFMTVLYDEKGLTKLMWPACALGFFMIFIQAFPTMFLFATVTLQYGLHRGASKQGLRFMFDQQLYASISFMAAIYEEEFAFDASNLLCFFSVHELPQFVCGSVSLSARGRVMVVDGKICLVSHVHISIYFRKGQRFIVMCLIEFKRKDCLEKNGQKFQNQYLSLTVRGKDIALFTKINSSSIKVGGIIEISLSPPNQLVKGKDELGAGFQNINGAECKNRERWITKEDDVRNVRLWLNSCFFTPWVSLHFSDDVLVCGDSAELMFSHSNPLQDGSLSKVSTRRKRIMGSKAWGLKDILDENLVVLALMDSIHILPHQWVLPAHLILLVVTGVVHGTLMDGVVVNIHDISTCANILEDVTEYTFRAVAFSPRCLSLVGYFWILVIIDGGESSFPYSPWIRKPLSATTSLQATCYCDLSMDNRAGASQQKCLYGLSCSMSTGS
ncbi:hypothetical protein Bca101_024708 [Brassica carinata]